MKKILALMLAVCLIFSLAGCGCAKKYDSDIEKVKETGKLVVGMTIYEPMNYKDDNGEYTGFDTEFAQAFCKKLSEKLGVTVEASFQEIDWETKFIALEAGEFDCVWNGMTITPEAKKNASVSNPYVRNKQVVVMKKDVLSKYTTEESLMNVSFAVENGSAGAGAISDTEKYKGTITKAETQAKALMEVASGASEACVIDYTMALAMTGEGTSYADLGIALTLTDEEYGVAFRKGSDLTAEFNAVMTELVKDGTLSALAEKYKVELVEEAPAEEAETEVTALEETIVEVPSEEPTM